MPEPDLDSTSILINVVQGDITHVHADAIVNAANSNLSVGSGVCGAIHDAAGPLLEEECESLGGCRTGDAVITGAYEIAHAKFVIHAVGPMYFEDPDKAPMLLLDTYRAILNQCRNHRLTSVAIPCISTGIYGYPKEPAARIAIEAVTNFANLAPTLSEIIFCCYGSEDFEIYNRLLGRRPCEDGILI